MSNAAPSIANREVAHPSTPKQSPPDPKVGASDKLILTMIAGQARLNPKKLAVVMGPSCLTYAELESRASQLANYLQSRGASPQDLIGICLDRSPDFVIAAMAILKCGAAYLPMDPTHPTDRLRFMIKDAGVGLIVTQAKSAERFDGASFNIVALDTDKEAITQQSNNGPALRPEIEHLAYVIYTSGSTGQPKGVEITHRNLSNLIAWHVGAFALDSSARTTFQAGVGFDAAVWEIWPTLATGAALYLPDDSTRLAPEALRDWFVKNQITISFFPTAIAEQLISFSWPPQTALRFLLTGADTLHRYPPPGLPFVLVNNYGPTECTVVATSGVVTENENHQSPPSIGFPISNVRIHILDEQLQEVSNDVVGEIYIGGTGVARGYRNRPELTAERFVPDPFGDKTGRLYRTGDLARRLSNGEIAFGGRIDDQVKIRGFRIELGEVNAVLNSLPSVQASVVIAREDVPGEKKLVAYIVPASSSGLDEKSLRDAIRQRLPDYMEPSAFVRLDSLPLTPNGKIDRIALPPVYIEDGLSGRDFVAARTPVEEALAGIIADVLKLPRVSINDDFFHLGAHSLLGAQIIARVRGAFGTELKLLDVFDAPTVAELAERIEDALLRQLNSMSEAEVDAALSALDGAATAGTHSQ